MSQWGSPRTLQEDGIAIDVIAHVATEPWQPINLDSKIDLLILLTVVRGSIEDATAMFQELSKKYVGRPYSEWLA